jgi:16S rRNA (adenine1518-N6/adenine1519-N6)-dimethyltransferase
MLDKLPSLTEVVRLHGLAANKKLGQHFLLDMNITDKIARLTTPLIGVTVAEIGPGPGGLTRSLFRAGAENVLAIEMDARFLPALEDIGNAVSGTLKVINGDGLKVDIAREAQAAKEIKIAANLPYNVGTKMLTNWLTAEPLFWSRAVLMFQKEVAERVVAQVGDKAYGRLAILAQSVCETDYAFTVPASAFSPPPKVDSAVVVLNVLPAALRYPHLKQLGEVTNAAFGQRRKMLRKSLKTFAAKHELEAAQWCEACGIDPQKRPEELPPKAFQTLTEFVVSTRA